MLDVISILEKMESLNFIRLNKVVGDYYQCYCPFHSDGQERRPSFGVRLNDQYKNGQNYPAGFSHCFTCGYANTLPAMISDILKQKKISKSGLDWMKENIPGFDESDAEFDYLISQDIMQVLQAKYAANYIQSIVKPRKIDYVPESELMKYRVVVPYMYERGLTDEIIEKYDIGVDLNYVPKGRKNPVPCITFPVRDMSGHAMFVARRSIKGKWFYLPKELEKPVYGLYELPKGCKSVDIVESVFNLTSCVKYGRPAICLLGTGTPHQINILRRSGIKEFRLGLDPDEAGYKGINRLKRGLKDVAVIWTYDIPENKDINDLTEQEFNNLQIS